MEENLIKNSNIIIEQRKKINLSGVKDCISFDDETIILNTVLGRVAIKGFSLHIINFDTNSGDLTAEGKICAVIYTADEQKGGLLSRIFK
ncbi:MAG: sporulation protein YabP [Acutalibacteraceae bacterium]|nr:sporulation protein YabP [Acutalibacteraceae bacterium]